MPVRNSLHRSAFAAFAMLAILAACPGAASAAPLAAEGAISATDAELEQGLDLSGAWELYWGRLLGPEDFRAGYGKGDLKPALVQVPGVWNPPGSGRTAEGWATYRMVVNLPETPAEPLGLYLKDVGTAYRLFCNGSLLVENGKVSSQPGGTRGSYAPQAVFFTAVDRLEIVLQVSNDEEVAAGVKTAPRLGYQSSIAPQKSRETLIDAIIYAAILIMGLYHVLLAILHPAEKASLYFGLLAIDLAVRGALTGARIVSQFAAGIGFHNLTAAEFITVYAAALIIFLYFSQLFPEERPRFATIPVIAVNAAYCLLPAFIPIRVLVPAHFYYEFFLLAQGVLITVWLVRSLVRRRDGAVIMFVGFLVMLASTIHDIILDIRHTGGFFTSSYAMAVFIFLQSALIALRYARAYLSAREQYRRSEALAASYHRFVPREFLSLLGKQSIENVSLGDQVEMRMSVLFADIRSFTTLSENLTPVENFNFLNSYLSRISPVIRRHGGFIDKYIGDSVMALFAGSPADAVRAGLDLLETVRTFNVHRASSGYRPISIGVGINTGTLMLGTVGESSRMEGTVISDAVNLASRLEKLTRTFGSWIIVSGDLFKGCPEASDLPHRYLGRVRVKGKSRPVEVYEIIDSVDQVRIGTRERFEAALRSFEGRRREDAAAGFRAVLSEDPSDPAARYFLERVAESRQGEEEAT